MEIPNKINSALKPVQEYDENDSCFLFSLQVRYHSRKRLAEQRPRIRGQFVRQLGYAFLLTVDHHFCSTRRYNS